MPGLSREAPATRSGVIWLTGFSGAGKTTVARAVERRLRESDQQVVFLDGDDLRSIFAGRWGYERADRVELASVYFRLCSHLASQGFVVVISAVAMYDEVRTWVRANIPRSMVAYLDVPHDVRVSRDAGTKRIYASGADLEQQYDVPADPELRIANFGETTPAAAAELIVERFLAGADEHVVAEADRGKSAHWDSYYRSTTNAPTAPSPFALKAQTRFPRGAHVVEVGCGNGRDTVHLAASGHQVVGLDASAAAIRLCQQTHADSTAEFVAGTLPDLAESWLGRFDVLYTRFVIHAMTEREEVGLWRDARRVLKPGGMLAIETRSINDPLARQGEVLSPTERIAGHYRRFIVLDELEARLRTAGFAVDDVVESNGLAVHKDDDPVVIRAFARHD